MKVFNVTIPYKKMPAYRVTGIEAKNQAAAKVIAQEQAAIECGNHPHGALQVREVRA